MGERSLTPGEKPARAFRLLLEYDGTGFMGWQVQPCMRTVQGELEQTLARILGTRVRVTGAGRTDRGVHALGQAAGFMAATDRSAGEILSGLNACLPLDVRVRDVREVHTGFHARHSALRRRYRYLMRLEPTAIDRDRCWVLRHAVKVGRMRKAVVGLLGEHDFRRFTIGASETEHTRAIIYETSLKKQGPVLRFEIEGNRFLRRMVRAIVGTLVEVGRGRFDTDVFRRALCPEGEILPFAVAPARGLYLVSVTYDEGPPGPSGGTPRNRRRG
ncbi:MAG: tRNA pseudouridine(38-40) synthase TruA [Candidatus Eisenbacteria sp.]|nr:tRNA pseudouridine(38-40) synthase TruA [Candidatus Eisenbacteria bacterium]